MGRDLSEIKAACYNLRMDIIEAACHCETVRFEITLSDGLASARRCDCSYCRMRGAIAVTAPVGGIRFLAGEDRLACYQFRTKTAKHYFCSVCGIYTHHQRRSNPNEYGVNVACLEGVSPFDFIEVPVTDGVNHSSDGETDNGIVGILRFEKKPAAKGNYIKIISKVDPIIASRSVLIAIESGDGSERGLERLRTSLDAFIYAISTMETQVGSIESVDIPKNIASESSRRQKLSSQFPSLGLYWTVLETTIHPENTPEKSETALAVGDAIDDLLDIEKELNEVVWLYDNHGRDEALAGLNFRNQSHIHMHLWPLRWHLEELRRR
jgi:hypothetical protein